MPYIKRNSRIAYDELIEEIVSILRTIDDSELDGRLNYIISRLLFKAYFADGVRYVKINRAVGVLECAKLELYRRIAAPYEDKKRRENGDVYG